MLDKLGSYDDAEMGNDTGNNTTAYLFRQEQLSRKATLGQ